MEDSKSQLHSKLFTFFEDLKQDFLDQASIGPHRLNLGNEQQTTNYALVGEQIVKLLREGRRACVRELYYSLSDSLKDKRDLDLILSVFCKHLQCCRSDFGLRASNKGLVFGQLTIANDNGTVDCNNEARLISDLMITGKTYTTAATIVLIIEKETVFQNLLECYTASKTPLNFLMITGKGYPDFITLEFIRILIKATNIIPYYIGDYDPYGIDIFLKYVYGSKNPACQKLEHLELRWLGPFHADVEALNPSVTLPLKARGIAILRNFKKRNLGALNDEIEKMLKLGQTCELEAFYSVSHTHLFDKLVLNKIQDDNYMIVEKQIQKKENEGEESESESEDEDEDEDED